MKFIPKLNKILSFLILIKFILCDSISLESLLSISNKNTTALESPNSIDDIILETLQNNPKSVLPSLPKIVTKSGQFCDFPFVYNNIKYYDQCALRKDEKLYCKVHFKSTKANQIISNENKMFNHFFDINSELRLLKIKDDYFSECLSLDETENFMQETIDTNISYDFNKKLLIDLFFEIKIAIGKYKEDKLNLLFELSENYCKSTNFTFDCLFENLILPISKSKELSELNKRIFEIFEKYKNKVKRMVDSSMNFRFKQMEFEFIIEKNVNFDVKNLTQLNDTKFMQSIEDEIETLISKELVEKNSVNSKISLRQFFEILISTYDICIEECKNALEYLFIDNFNEDLERIKIEVVLRLFNQSQVNENEFLTNLYSNSNATEINYNNQKFKINPQISRFLNYKSWSTRYLITVIYRYILMEKLFYIDIIKGEMTEEEMNRILFLPKEFSNEKEKIKLIKLIPILTPYINFSEDLQIKLKEIYEQSNLITNQVQENLSKINSTFTKFKNVTEYLSYVLNGRLDYIKTEGNSKIKRVKDSKREVKNISEVLQNAQSSNSIFKSIQLESELKNLNQIMKNIYNSNFLSHKCHKFIHYQTYFDEFAYGKPLLNYVSLSFEPFFFIDFEKEIKLFFIYGLLNLNLDYKKKFNVVIKTQARIDLYIKNFLREPTEVTNLEDSERYKNLYKYVYQIETPGFVNSYKEMVIKGRFDKTDTNENVNKYIEVSILPISSNSTNKNPNQEATNKCDESLIEVAMCFNPFSYIINCEVACKFLSDKTKSKLLERKYIKESEKLFYGEIVDKNKIKGDPLNPNKRLKMAMKKINSTNDSDQDKIKLKIDNFLYSCENYCNAFMWSIPNYKCLYRNILDHEFNSLLIKCGATGNWKLQSRNNNNSNWFKHFNDFSQNDILLGKKFLVENSNQNLKLNFIPFIQPSILNPISNVTFIENFNYDKISEFLFGSGDMEKFVAFDKFQPFIKGIPHTAYTNYNHKLLSKVSSQKKESLEISIFNLIFNDEKMDNQGVIIYGEKYNFTQTSNNNNYVIFSDNNKFNENKNFEKDKSYLLKQNQGANFYTRNNNANCLMAKPFFTSNLASKEFYTENTLLTKNIFGYADTNYLILKVPEILDRKVLSLKTIPFQTKYSININEKSRIYLAVEITKYFGSIAEGLYKDSWSFLNGTQNMIEMITSDIGDDILYKNEYSFYECNFNKNNNPICFDNLFSHIEKIQMSIFYKDVNVGNFPIKYSFFDFDDLYGSLHLVMMQPLQCRLHKGYFHTNKDKINNYMILIEDNLPSFDSDIEQYFKDVSKSEFAILKVPVNITDDTMINKIFNLTEKEKIINKNKNNKSDKNSNATKHRDNYNDEKFDEYLNFLETHYNINNPIINESIINKNSSKLNSNSTLTFRPKLPQDEFTKLTSHFTTQLLGHKNYSKPHVKFNQNGCILALDRFGSLYYKTMSNILNKNNSTLFKWKLIKEYVKSFDLSENVLLVMDYEGHLQMQRGFNQKNECVFHPNHWINLKFDLEGIYVKKFSLSQFNCFWLIDSFNKVYYSDNYDFLSSQNFNVSLKFVKMFEDQNYIYKSVYQNSDKVYFITRTNQILVRKDIFNVFKNKCEIGFGTEVIDEFNKNNKIVFRKIQENIHSPFVALDENGKLFYRRFMNEINLIGNDWDSIKLPIEENELNRIVDFELGPKDLITINANGRVIILYDINRPRIYDE